VVPFDIAVSPRFCYDACHRKIATSRSAKDDRRNNSVFYEMGFAQAYNMRMLALLPSGLLPFAQRAHPKGAELPVQPISRSSRVGDGCWALAKFSATYRLLTHCGFSIRMSPRSSVSPDFTRNSLRTTGGPQGSFIAVPSVRR
jgi:hypothetical protein